MGKGGSKTRLPAGMDALSLIQAQAARKGVGGRNMLLRQVQEGLKTGGIGARIPIVGRAVEASRAAGQQALASTKDDLATRRVGGQLGLSTLARVGQASKLATSRIPTDLTSQFLSEFGKQSMFGIPGGALASGSAGSSRPDTLGAGVGAGGEVVGALIRALAMPRAS